MVNVNKIIAVFSVIWLLLLGYFAATEFFLPDAFSVLKDAEFSYMDGLLTVRRPQTALAQAALTASGSSYNASIYLFDLVPIKNVRVSAVEERRLVPGGMVFGVKLFTDGVIVVGFSDVQTSNGSRNPAAEAGIKLGDVLVSVDGRKITGNSDLSAIVSSCSGGSITVEYERDGQRIVSRLLPVQAKDGSGYKAGMWVRDSSAGIGTVTYINEETGRLAGLGHGITDSDTKQIVPVESGEIVRVDVTSVEKGQSGAPGELVGDFHSDEQIASLDLNCEAGVYGAIQGEIAAGEAVPVALKQEVKKGAAVILSTVDASGPRRFDIEIETINLSDNYPTKNMVIRVTDPDLLAATGGIVQGMSGSPILQDGRLVGAVTHVFVNEPTRGYGILIENMLDAERTVDAKPAA